MPFEPALYRGGLVGGIIVDDEMQVEIGRCPFVDGVEEAEELAMPVAGHAFADDGAVEHVESREQGGGAVALVVMRHRPATSLLHRQPRLGAVKGLDLALFIDRQYQGLVGWIDVEADDILDLGDEVRIARELEGFRQMRLEPVRGPDLVHRRRRDAGPPRHRALAPMGGSGGFSLSVRFTTCLILLSVSGLRPGGRVASFNNPSTPLAACVAASGAP